MWGRYMDDSRRVVTRTLDWKEIVQRAWGKDWDKPDPAYEFTGHGKPNRSFEDNPHGGPYEEPAA